MYKVKCKLIYNFGTVIATVDTYLHIVKYNNIKIYKSLIISNIKILIINM